MAKKHFSLFGRIKNKIKSDNERGARENVLEELFYDFNRSRAQVYKINFFRGIVFGAGTVIGGSLVIAIVVWLLSWLGTIFPPLHDFLGGIAHILNSAKK